MAFKIMITVFAIVISIYTLDIDNRLSMVERGKRASRPKLRRQIYSRKKRRNDEKDCATCLYKEAYDEWEGNCDECEDGSEYTPRTGSFKESSDCDLWQKDRTCIGCYRYEICKDAERSE